MDKPGTTSPQATRASRRGYPASLPRGLRFTMNDRNHQDHPRRQSAASSSWASTITAYDADDHQPEVPANSRNPPRGSGHEERDHHGPRPRRSNEAGSIRASQITRNGDHNNSRHSERSLVQVASADRLSNHSSGYAGSISAGHRGSRRDNGHRASGSHGAQDQRGQDGRSSQSQSGSVAYDSRGA